MTAEIVNLRQFRKQKVRQSRDRDAAENRARHGRKKSVRQTEALENEVAARDMDGKRLQSEDEPRDS